MSWCTNVLPEALPVEQSLVQAIIKMWRVVRSLYVDNKTCIFSESNSQNFFLLSRGGSRCALWPTLFLIHINGLMCEIEKCLELSVKLSENILSGLLFANDFVVVARLDQHYKKIIDIVHNYSKRWHFETNVKKCAVVILSELGKF